MGKRINLKKVVKYAGMGLLAITAGISIVCALKDQKKKKDDNKSKYFSPKTSVNKIDNAGYNARCVDDIGDLWVFNDDEDTYPKEISKPTLNPENYSFEKHSLTLTRIKLNKK